jgi:hypothetical protein
MKESRPNIRIRSNIYPLGRDIFKEYRAYRFERTPVSKQSAKFIKQIRGKKALLEFVKKLCGDLIHEQDYVKQLRSMGFEEWQIKLYWDLENCSLASDGHVPVGLVAPKRVGLRCKNQKCRFFDKNKNNCGTIGK